MTPTITINPQEIARLEKTLTLIEKATGKSMKDLNRQGMIYALQSAAKYTKPGMTAKVSKLPQKYKFRPLVSAKSVNLHAWIMPSGKIWYDPDSDAAKRYFYVRPSGAIFSTPSPLNKSRRGDASRVKPLKKVSKAIKKWNKQKNDWSYIPYDKAKRDLSDKRFRIPHAGAAKGAWLHSLPKLGGFADLGALHRSTRPLSVMTEKNSFIEQYINVVNNVDYTSITSPASASTGIRKANNRLVGAYQKKLEKIVNTADLKFT
jgi:hypothetical protein